MPIGCDLLSNYPQFVNFMSQIKDMERYSLSTLTDLENLQTNICIDDVPKPFRKDLLRFIVGHTLVSNKNGKLLIGRNLYSLWITKLCKEGFDENVNLLVDGD